MKLANNIRYLRKSKGFSQDDIAERLGYKSFTTIQKWESGVAEPPISALLKLSQLFGYSLNDLTSKDIESGEYSLCDHHSAIEIQYNSLDEIDRAKVEAYIDGLLSADKYQKKNTSAGTA